MAKGTDFDHVLLDNVAAAREGTRHLISLGHRYILLLASDPTLSNVRERIEGYREALAEADLSGCENVLVAGCNEAERARQVLMPVLASAGRPSALFAGTPNPLGSRAGTAKGRFVASVRRLRMVHGPQALCFHPAPTHGRFCGSGLGHADGPPQ